ncbi:MAG: hypothetical protein ACI808_003091 [Paraglaciecola sp.]|jgi:hypothetical protein
MFCPFLLELQLIRILFMTIRHTFTHAGMEVVFHIKTAQANPISSAIGSQHVTRFGIMLRRYRPHS